jgi:membrane associated rhomboid family serine protease
MIVFLLPAAVQELLKARSDSWNLLSFWTSTFVHSSFEHLLGNVASFLLLGFVVFGINRKSGREKKVPLVINHCLSRFTFHR